MEWQLADTLTGWQLVGDRRLEGGGTEQKGKKTHGHGQQYSDFWGQGDLRELKDNVKKYKKDLKNKKVIPL